MNIELATTELRGPRLEFTPEVLERRETIIAAASMVARVTNAEENAAAVEAQKSIAQLLKDVEDARKRAKKPVLEWGEEIDASAKRFVEEPKAEQMRLAGLVGNFQEMELARARAEQAARALEQQRLEAERRAAILKEQEEERARLAKLEEERQRLATEAANADAQRRAEIEKLDAEARRQAELARASSAEKQDAINEEFNRANAATPIFEPVRTKGQIVRQDWEITVTDIHKLVRAHPLCVKMEPIMSEIRMLLDSGITPPGVTAKKVTKATVSTRRTTIDV